MPHINSSTFSRLRSMVRKVRITASKGWGKVHLNDVECVNNIEAQRSSTENTVAKWRVCTESRIIKRLSKLVLAIAIHRDNRPPFKFVRGCKGVNVIYWFT